MFVCQRPLKRLGVSQIAKQNPVARLQRGGRGMGLGHERGAVNVVQVGLGHSVRGDARRKVGDNRLEVSPHEHIVPGNPRSAREQHRMQGGSGDIDRNPKVVHKIPGNAAHCLVVNITGRVEVAAVHGLDAHANGLSYRQAHMGQLDIAVHSDGQRLLSVGIWTNTARGGKLKHRNVLQGGRGFSGRPWSPYKASPARRQLFSSGFQTIRRPSAS